MKKISFQFVKIPNELEETNLQIVALWGMAAGCLTNPEYSGALKPKLKSFIADGTPFEPQWREFRKKYLKSVLIPNGENHFEVRYELYATPHPELPHTTYLKATPAREYIRKQPTHYVEQDGTFTPVPVEMLKDERMSLKAKGLFVAIQKLMTLAENMPQEDIKVTKNELMKRNGLKISSINTPWNELKELGYLHQRRYYEVDTGLFAWGYQLFEMPFEHKYVAKLKPTTDKKQTLVKAEKASAVAETEIERKVIEEQIKTNIEYDNVLIPNAESGNVHYSVKEINGILQVIVDTVCSKKQNVKINGEKVKINVVRAAFMRLDTDDIIYVIDNLQAKSGEIKNITAYTITALYNASLSVR